ncbi:MAG TPA: NADH-quinone oxidoreductase subunit N [Bryobacteraceae bacterium]|nr:NADH-quinone oxidoreductase subunit N [Bryobacteraceae bacterium]
MNQFYTATDHFALLPAIMLALFGCAVLLFDFFVFQTREMRRWLVPFAITGLVFTGVSLVRQGQYIATTPAGEIAAFKGSLVIDRFALFFNWLFLAASALVLAISARWTRMQESREGDNLGELSGLVLLANSGMYFLATGIDLITLFVGLELMAISFYVLVGFNRHEKRSNEAAMKYLLLGAFSSGFLAYGMSLLYGIAGSTKLRDIAAAVGERGALDLMVTFAMITTAVGLLFKVSAVPFHMWAPDAYEGAPTPVTAYLSVASKAASFAFLVRMFMGPFQPARDLWVPLLSGVAVASLVIGNFAAITQTNVKRLLAYSSISHAGYILLGLIAGNPTGLKGIAVYLGVYAFMTLGAFFIVASLQRRREYTETLVPAYAAVSEAGSSASGRAVMELAEVRTALRTETVPAEDIEDFNGLFHRHPAYACWMLLFLLSLAGIPPTAGFIGKYYIFFALIETGHITLAVIGVVFAAVALYYYFRIVKSMFMGEPAANLEPATAVGCPGFRLAIITCAIATLAIGIYPEPFLRFAQVIGR